MPQRVTPHNYNKPQNQARGYKTEFILKLKIKHNDWQPADTCPQAANHCALF